ncbi:ABC transporter ATP-binding protein [Paenibacillus illinoisensis]|uniref:ABC transporter ATP-binding protein n=1 Tax=Paenibacillus illinoisensis TaxID=59845 RepID=UPI001C8E216A|nr:ATP-binding cassette domain-containing protein [Paenibacillus illinoisensis]MBY0217800.1 ATP-binding cassette domain-containing protein [Paenibacillus illinoisensis]
MRNQWIQLESVTKDYGEGKGIFDINLNIKEGEVFGLVGINGSGKTTIIRHLMGFLKADKGFTSIASKNCWKQAAELKKVIGYVPGEIAFPDVRTGAEFLKWQADYIGMKNMDYANELVERFNLDINATLKRMSKGMKQKTAIVNAFMASPNILLLDEPTTGLDPLMQKTFVDLVLEEKKKGKTVFMSSHIFSELESTCDRVAFLKDGRIIDIVNMNEIRGEERIKEYKIGFTHEEEFQMFKSESFTVTRVQNQYKQVTVQVPDDEVEQLFHSLSHKEVDYLTHNPLTLENYFIQKYSEMESA